VSGSEAQDDGMTTSNLTTATALAEAPLGADDPRMTFAHAVALATAVIGRVGPQQLDNPTPCPEYDVRALMGHLVTVLRRVAALGRGDDPFGPHVSAAVEGERHYRNWLAAAHDVQVAWNDDAVLTRTMRLPWAEQSGAAMLVSYVNEVTVHTWDLATATGQRPAWDPQVLSVAFDGIRFMPGQNRSAMFDGMRAAMPPELRDFSAPFADAVPVPDDAPLIDRLVAWNGRRPC
jgi:uncharacterized protein (TIGR03086 family)